ncbi:glutathione S-transferase family protein [Sulfitobacter albidus]|uniref:Glutathione S-transferase family protein n=1 Tax=Sulfitobacter albidus TaxID=2829501 RepID=A0A975PN69_9RHOB|nr:glutathione S-transferase family protein [Sulfitobacter albidus]QUJ77151.1 glutathione S-transferase family protein [Sulfitobacter albidus]
MSYVLHYAPDNASLIVRLALEHVGASYTTQLVDRARGAQRSAAFRALNPHGLIPALETPEGALFETGAILLWLSERHPGLAPVPGDPQRGAYLKWLFYVSNTLHPALRMTFYPDKYIGPAPADQARLRAGLRAPILTAFAALEDIAADAAWFGHGTGALDFYVAACLRWCAIYPGDTDRSWFDLRAFAHLTAMCARIEALPACAALIRAEGMNDTPFTAPDYPNPPEGSAI